MAAIRKLPSGRWQATVRHPAGHRLTKSDPLKRIVQAWAAQTETQLRNGEIVAERGRGVTVQQWHDRWIAARRVEKTTAHEERLRLAAYILPRWGTWPLRQIGRIDVQTWIADLAKERGPHVTYGCYMLFSKMLGDAELEGLIPATPCRAIELPKIIKPAPRWLTRTEYSRLLDAMRGKTVRTRTRHVPDPMAAQWEAMVAVACHSGLRSGELSGLDVSAVDFDRGLIRVDQVMTRFGLRDYPKSDSSRRSVPVHPDALAMLWRVVADRPSDAPVFQAPRGGRLHQGNFLKTVWHPALVEAGIEPVRAYVTRHTFASWLIQDGVPRWDIAQALGHRTTAFVDRYAFLEPDAHARIRATWSRAGDAPATHGVPQPGELPGVIPGQNTK
jgi:integrase